MGATKPEVVMPPLEHAAFSIAEFCSRNHISRLMYHRMRSQGRGPMEMRIGLNLIRVTAEAERDWQLRMQEPNADFERRATERAVKAGDAAVRSPNHVSISKRLRRGRQSPTA